MNLRRADFLAGSLAALGAAAPRLVRSAQPSETGTSPQQLLGRLMAGNRRFLDNDFPSLNRIAEKRELLVTRQAPFAAILACADSRVIPHLIFVQGIGDLFVTRVAGNYPDDVVIASLEYAVEHLGTRLIMVLGHQNCGAVKAVYTAIETNKPLPSHLSALETLMAPGITGVVRRRGSLDAAIEANTRAAVTRLRTSPPVLADEVKSGHLLVTGGLYHLRTGEVTVIDQ